MNKLSNFQVTIARIYNWDVHQRRRQAVGTSSSDKDSWYCCWQPVLGGGLPCSSLYGSEFTWTSSIRSRLFHLMYCISHPNEIISYLILKTVILFCNLPPDFGLFIATLWNSQIFFVPLVFFLLAEIWCERLTKFIMNNSFGLDYD